MFPEGTKEGLYHTTDATLWFFHAIHRYLLATDDRATLRQLMPKLKSIFEHHMQGTRFGIRVDPADGLLRQGEEGYQLTWMDAKVDDWWSRRGGARPSRSTRSGTTRCGSCRPGPKSRTTPPLTNIAPGPTRRSARSIAGSGVPTAVTSTTSSTRRAPVRRSTRTTSDIAHPTDALRGRPSDHPTRTPHDALHCAPAPPAASRAVCRSADRR